MVFVSIFSSAKNQLQIGKKLKNSDNFSLLYLPKNTRAKKFRRHFSPKRILENPRTLFEIMNPYLFSVMRYSSSGIKEPRKAFKKFKYFCQKNEGVILDEGTFVDPKSSLYPCSFSGGGMVSISFISIEKYEVQIRKKSIFIFFEHKNSMKKMASPGFEPGTSGMKFRLSIHCVTRPFQPVHTGSLCNEHSFTVHSLIIL